MLGTFFVRNTLGRSGEDIAVRFLLQLGYSIVDRNVTNPQGRRLGEIDIVAIDLDCVVFIEVKTRASKDAPLRLSIQKEKLRRLAKIGEWYMKQTNMKGKRYRFDLVGILLLPEEKPEVTHIQSIFL